MELRLLPEWGLPDRRINRINPEEYPEEDLTQFVRTIRMKESRRTDSPGLFPGSERFDMLSLDSTGNGTTTEVLRQESVEGSSPFDRIRHVDAHGEFWLARELMTALGYGQWRRFDESIERAMVSCENSGQDPTIHFSNIAGAGNNSIGRPAKDLQLSRYGCYLVAMNGDPRKPEIAAAQSYFAVKTREAEIRSSCSAIDYEKLGTAVAHAIQLKLQPTVDMVSAHEERICRLEEAVKGGWTESRKSDDIDEVRYSISMDTILGYCQRTGIQSNSMTRVRHTLRIRKALEKAGSNVVPIRKTSDSWSNRLVYFWPTWVLDRYFSYPENREYHVLGRQKIVPIVGP